MRPPAFCTITVSLYKLKAMFAFVSKTVNFREVLDEFALALQMQVIDNRIKLPEHVGKGYFAVEELPNGLQNFYAWKPMIPSWKNTFL